jgi:hypothetical protein
MTEKARECKSEEGTQQYKCNGDKRVLENAYLKLNADGECIQ